MKKSLPVLLVVVVLAAALCWPPAAHLPLNRPAPRLRLPFSRPVPRLPGQKTSRV